MADKKTENSAKPEELTIDEAFAKIEETAERLESEEISLEESFELYKKGMELLKDTRSRIEEVEQKVIALSSEGEENEFE
ncbi:MAG: exodeoxyribonuclease VII small subunit [Lachnospiraceae bacterium]|nr:exodeoxyribonuclease VII small subunit [Lachnospiraceae bacterium]